LTFLPRTLIVGPPEREVERTSSDRSDRTGGVV